jgi:hypothetical protein
LPNAARAANPAVSVRVFALSTAAFFRLERTKAYQRRNSRSPLAWSLEDIRALARWQTDIAVGRNLVAPIRIHAILIACSRRLHFDSLVTLGEATALARHEQVRRLLATDEEAIAHTVPIAESLMWQRF